jgi:hypothetical protein
MNITESLVHVSMRRFLKRNNWLLIAGEFPNGSDDELNVLSISDPLIAKDNSPDPRRHSLGEVVPDLVAYKNGCILVIEAKPQYSIADKTKLCNLLSNEKVRLISALKKFSIGKPQFSHIDYDAVEYTPVLAFGNPTYQCQITDDGFGHIYIKSLNEAKMCFFNLPHLEVLL